MHRTHAQTVRAEWARGREKERERESETRGTRWGVGGKGKATDQVAKVVIAIVARGELVVHIGVGGGHEIVQVRHQLLIAQPRLNKRESHGVLHTRARAHTCLHAYVKIK